MAKLTDTYNLKKINPKLAREWHPTKNGNLTPKDITSFKNKKVWWKCTNGHEWQTFVYSRNQGSGCRYCNRQKRLSA